MMNHANPRLDSNSFIIDDSQRIAVRCFPTHYDRFTHYMSLQDWMNPLLIFAKGSGNG